MLKPAVAAVLAVIAAGCAGHEAPRTPAAADPGDQAATRGQRIASVTCASCHAIAGGGVSPLPEATPFREIVRRYPLDQLEAAFAEGLVTGHPAMPPFVFRASEIDDLIAYLETVRDEP